MGVFFCEPSAASTRFGRFFSQLRKSDSGFDLIIGNPPFVTARNPIKRELYRERWPRVCHMKFLLVCPFFEMSFNLLRPNGQLGFIVSNAFAKREFGKPLVEDFFPTVICKKLWTAPALCFLAMARQRALCSAHRESLTSNCQSASRRSYQAAVTYARRQRIVRCGTRSEKNEETGFADSRVIIADRRRKDLAKWPWSFDLDALPYKKLIESHSNFLLRDFLARRRWASTNYRCK